MLNDFQAECPKCGNYAIFKETKKPIVFRCAECGELVEWPEQADDERQYLEAKVIVEFERDGSIFYSPLHASFSGHREAVANGEFAEVTIPYRPADETEPTYGFRCFIANKPASEPVIMEMMALQQHSEDLYKQFAAFARDPLDDLDEYEEE